MCFQFDPKKAAFNLRKHKVKNGLSLWEWEALEGSSLWCTRSAVESSA